MTACTMGGVGVGLWPLGMITMLGFWALLAWGGLHLYRTWGPSGGRAETALARRFAEGAIGEEEYRARLDVLRDERSAFEWSTRL